MKPEAEVTIGTRKGLNRRQDMTLAAKRLYLVKGHVWILLVSGCQTTSTDVVLCVLRITSRALN